MKRIIFYSCFIFCAALPSFGQTKTISGTVVDETDAPIVGVTVAVQGTNIVAVTSLTGSFSINLPDGSNELSFTSVGYLSQRAPAVTGMKITLVKNIVSGEDVVVVGYQTVKRKDITGSISSVSSREIKDVPVSSAAEALQGRLAGVQITASEGAPGADIIVRVRGGGSITQDNAPLYIVDGVPVENALSVIAPQDIASVDVLKDASTTAIYGARAANGVVMITTKSGRAGKTQISLNTSFGFRKLPNTMKVLSPYEFVRWQYERSRGSIADSSSFAQIYGTTWDTLSVYKDIAPINWQEEVFGRTAAFQNHNLSVTGGGQSTTFSLSATWNKEDGIQLESGFDRKLVNFKIENRATDKLRIGANVRYIDQEIKGAGTTNSGTRATNRLRHAINYRPFELPTPNGGIDDFDEAYYLASSGATNPVLLTEAEYRRQYSKGIYMTGFLNYNLLKNLVFRSTVGLDNVDIKTDLFYSKITSQARNYASLPLASIGTQNNRSFTNSNTLQYSLNNINDHHDVNILIGQEIVQQRVSQNSTETRYFPAEISAEKALANMGLGSAPSGSAQPLPTSFIQPPSRIASFFGRIGYNYDDKYIFNFNLRADRSSKFSSENGTLVFPSASFAWRFNKEKMFSNIDWLSDGKLRLGFGSVGNNRIDNLLYLQLYGVTGQYAFNHSILPGYAPTALANPKLKWERNNTANAGIDMSFLNNRLHLNIDVYKNSAKDLLLAVAIPPTSGYTSQIQNVGSTTNSGLEIQLGGTPLSTSKGFIWTSNFNIAFNKNKVVSLGGVTQIERNSGWQGSDGVADYLVKVGQPVGLMYGFVTDGFYKVEDFDYNTTTGVYTIKTGIAANGVYGTPQPGMLKWKDLDGDGNITADKDRMVIGNANPKFTGGWNNQFAYKNFDMSVFLNFVVGNDVYNANKLEWTDGSFSNLNMLDIMKDRWTNIDANGNRITDPTALAALNENATIWSPVRVQRWWLHSWAVEDGSYLRVNNLTLGYTIPSKTLRAIRISSIRAFATVNNVATITGYSGYDPDVTARRSDPLTPGVDFAAYPRSRTWVFGLNVNF